MATSELDIANAFVKALTLERLLDDLAKIAIRVGYHKPVYRLALLTETMKRLERMDQTLKAINLARQKYNGRQMNAAMLIRRLNEAFEEMFARQIADRKESSD